ncbi:MAG: PUR family DNA/RNA-binding protein [Bacteroidaceae bacterium]|nr:PUR family DNA/RNA-binding protein [Bacteroidaceae bacterium]
MEELNKKSAAEMDRDICFSNSIKAGKRIYYVDVKKTRKNEMYLAITESKKNISGEGDNASVSYEKHKIFLYQEDFQKFLAGLQDAMEYIAREQGEATPREEPEEELGGEIKINLDF